MMERITTYWSESSPLVLSAIGVGFLSVGYVAIKLHSGPRKGVVYPPGPNLDEMASTLHAKAWGKQWPQDKGIISKTEICGDESGLVDDADDDDDVDNALVDKLKVPPHFDYEYFKEILSLKIALGASPDRDSEDVLVVREEYVTLRQELEDDRKHYRTVVVTGHPGIGKTTFLFYLLLYRLERKLPTAIQLDAEHYFIFDEQGAIAHSLPDRDSRVAECWALTDSNDKVLGPCSAFNSAKRVILASPPEPKRWKEWIKQTGGDRMISDLPSVPEIAAIAKELRKQQTQPGEQPLYDPSSTLSLVRKWGPSTRNIINSMRCAALGRDDSIEKEAKTAAIRICNNPSAISEIVFDLMLQSGGSSVIFLRRTPNGSVTSGGKFIPTQYLRALFEEQRQKLANKESLQLFFALSSHAFTRSASGWHHEKKMHERLGKGGAKLIIFQGSEEHNMQPSTHLLPGTLAGLKEAGSNDSFYWIPSVANFPGVDSVLGDTAGNVYTIQATIANTHTSPEQGIKKVWEQFRPEIRTSRTWHYVVITKSKQTADANVEVVSKQLREFTLGPARAHVRVWACVL